jgi:hypothetical protein
MSMAFLGFLAGAALGGLAGYALGAWTSPSWHYWHPYYGQPVYYPIPINQPYYPSYGYTQPWRRMYGWYTYPYW